MNNLVHVEKSYKNSVSEPLTKSKSQWEQERGQGEFGDPVPAHLSPSFGLLSLWILLWIELQPP
jgi:hypothetical protein